MDKIMFRLLLVFGFIIIYTDSISQIPISGQRVNVIEIYSSQIGVKELTGSNDGKDIEKYLRTVGLGKGYPWCAAFVKWCLLQANVESAAKINGMALSCYKKDGLVYNYGRWLQAPIRGDVFTLYYMQLKRIGHTGFYDGKANKEMGTFFTVEGNTNNANSRDGDGCYRRIRQLGSNTAISRWFN